MEPWHFRSTVSSHNDDLLMTARYQQSSAGPLNKITDSTLRKMHEQSGSIVRKIVKASDMSGPLANMSERAQAKRHPHYFSKNALTREQLDELLDMKEVKKMLK